MLGETHTHLKFIILSLEKKSLLSLLALKVKVIDQSSLLQNKKSKVFSPLKFLLGCYHLKQPLVVAGTFLSNKF